MTTNYLGIQTLDDFCERGKSFGKERLYELSIEALFAVGKRQEDAQRALKKGSKTTKFEYVSFQGGQIFLGANIIASQGYQRPGMVSHIPVYLGELPHEYKDEAGPDRTITLNA